MKKRYSIPLAALAILAVAVGCSVKSTIDACANGSSTSASCAKVNKSMDGLDASVVEFKTAAKIETPAVDVAGDIKAEYQVRTALRKGVFDRAVDAAIANGGFKNIKRTTKVWTSYARVDGKDVIVMLRLEDNAKFFSTIDFDCSIGYYTVTSQRVDDGDFESVKINSQLVPPNSPIAAAYLKVCYE